MSTESQHQLEQWKGSYTFILAATGAAAGLGNIWKFPYLVGMHGGGAFILTYLFFVLLIGFPLFMAEIMLGRSGRMSPSQSIRNIAKANQFSQIWAGVGILITLAAFLILSYYSVIAGQVVAYFFRTVSGVFTGQSEDGVAYLYNSFRSNPEVLLSWHTIFLVVTCMIVARGFRHGIEKTVRICMPLLIAMLIFLAIYQYNTSTFLPAASFMLDVDFKKLFYLTDSNGFYMLDAQGDYQFTFRGVLVALGHAFFTLAIGVGSVIVYSIYLNAEISAARVTTLIIVLDTLIALLAGFIIFPMLFAYGLSPGHGTALVFKTLPMAFGEMEQGSLLGGLFFLMLFFAALTSAIALLEPGVRWVMERFKLSRVAAVTWVGTCCWTFGIISVFSVSGTRLRDIIQSVDEIFKLETVDMSQRFYDLTAFQVIDGLVTVFILPTVGLFIAILCGWIIPENVSRDGLRLNSTTVYRAWLLMIRFITPALVGVVFFISFASWISDNL
jgi:NSS family neurotransmitter:Na+ symporter